MEAREKALRAQDIQAGLQGLTEVPSLIEAELETTLLIGMATRLAIHIRGAEVFDGDDIVRLKYVASSLGINATSFRSVLDVLREAEFVQVITGTGGKIKTVRESVPVYGDLYEAVGQVYEAKDHTEIENALIQSYGQLVEAPKLDDGNLAIQHLSKHYQAPLLDVAGAASIIRVSTPTASGRVLFYAPQYWDENHDKMIAVMEQHGDERVRAVIKKVNDYQGLPISKAPSASQDVNLLRNLAHVGILPSPIVNGGRGERAFAFTPFKNDGHGGAVTTKILEKTRAILACVRYGEHFASITSIRQPLVLLRALASRGRLGAHSEAYNQYRLLIDQGIGRISRDTAHTDRFVLHFIDTDENKIALAAAIDTIEGGEPFAATHIEPDVANYVLNGDYTEPPTARARKKYAPSAEAFATMQTEIIEMFLIQ